MASVFFAALFVASVGQSASTDVEPAPSLHWARVAEPGDYWVWGVLKPNGSVRPADFSGRRPSFETNGVVSERIASDGLRVRASDADALADARRAIGRSGDVDDDDSGGSSLPDPSIAFREVGRRIFWGEALVYLIPAFLLAGLAVVVLAVASRVSRPPV